jgi:Ni/Co efflux regulator RcnB
MAKTAFPLVGCENSENLEVYFMAKRKHFYPLGTRLPLAARQRYWAIRDARLLALASMPGHGEYWGEAAEIPY